MKASQLTLREYAMSGTGIDSEDKTADSTAKSELANAEQPDNGSTAQANAEQPDSGSTAQAKEIGESNTGSDNTVVNTETNSNRDISKETDTSDAAISECGATTGTTGDASRIKATEKASSLTLTQHHVSHLLSDVLQDESANAAPPGKGFRFPMIFDLLLGAGLLVAVGGFTVGLLHMYIVHSASQFISDQRYERAITILKGAPLPQVFSRPGTDTEELLSKARYLDAMDKIESNSKVDFALRELAEIRPGSKYFALAQEAINENTEPAEILLQGGTETTAAPAPEQEQTLLEKTLKEDKED